MTKLKLKRKNISIQYFAIFTIVYHLIPHLKNMNLDFGQKTF